MRTTKVNHPACHETGGDNAFRVVPCSRLGGSVGVLVDQALKRLVLVAQAQQRTSLTLIHYHHFFGICPILPSKQSSISPINSPNYPPCARPLFFVDRLARKHLPARLCYTRKR